MNATRRPVAAENLQVGMFTFLHGFRRVTEVKIMPRARRVVVRHGADEKDTLSFGEAVTVYVGTQKDV
jgi:hypothetical protein